MEKKVLKNCIARVSPLFQEDNLSTRYYFREKESPTKVRLLLTRVANCLLSMPVYRCDMQVRSHARFSPIYSSILYEDSESDATDGFFLAASSKDRKLDIRKGH